MTEKLFVGIKVSVLLTATLLIGCGGGSEDNTQVIPVSPAVVTTCNADTEFFCFSRDGGESVLFEEKSGTVVAYDPNIYARYLQSSGVIAITLQHDINPPSLPYGLTITISASAPGTYYLDGTMSNTAAYSVIDNEIPYTYVLPAYTSGTITIDSYGGVGEYVTGSFEMTLCSWDPTLDAARCADQNNLTTLTGTFSAIRDSDV